MKTKHEYQTILRNNICVVEFTKKDGTNRSMICTLKQDKLPASSATSRTVTVPDHQVRVFDIQKQDWRSFNVDTVVSFNTVEE